MGGTERLRAWLRGSERFGPEIARTLAHATPGRQRGPPLCRGLGGRYGPPAMPEDDPRFHGLYGIAGPRGPGPFEERRFQTLATADALLEAGVPVLQLRDKASDGRELVQTARLLAARAHARGALFLVNDRLDVALLAGADGVHLGQDDLSVEDVRRVLSALGRTRARFVVGLSTHDLQQVRAGVRQQPDYLGFGPVFPTSTKPDALAPRGIARLAEAVEAAGSLPVVAIGGLGLNNVGEVAAARAAMAAVISDLAGAVDPAGRARAIQLRFEACARR